MWKSAEHHKIAELYDLKNTLGRGHFAVVKLAEHVFSGEKVAVKVIDKTKMDQISADHLYHEVTCMKLVQHPNVVRLYQVIETPSKLYLILELGDGGDMFDYIMRHDRGLHEDKAKEYFAQIVSAIAYCHKLHVVHRDLKPENVVFFESQGLVKLTDFGFSNHYRPGEKLSTSCGSLAYSAPEILLGEEYDAPAVDVWSLGVILYMLVCGVAPFNEANDSETLINIMDCRYKVLDHVSEECQDLIQSMIIREPSERITLSDIVNHPWLKGAKSLGRARRNSTPILVRNSIPEHLHKHIVDMMLKAKLADEKEIEVALAEDRYDHITSTYFLLAERALLQQEPPCASPTSSCSSDEEQTDGAVSSVSTSEPKAIPNKLRPMYTDIQGVASHSASMYSVSPPCKQATMLPSAPPIAETSRRRTTSSSSEESNPSFIFPKNPSFIREHLTITPRHGFSVAHGGIDTLIEEEERSRSQTTTDDEADVGDEITNFPNPNILATHLQRASLQMKRIKKRKSAPVLNEICEENEMEGENVDDVPLHKLSNMMSHSGRHSISTSSPTNRYRSKPHEVAMVRRNSDDSRSPTLFGVRTGRPLRRRRSHKSSSSETSDDDSESRRTSTTNLSNAVNTLLLHRRDSSDDDDRGFGGGKGLDPPPSGDVRPGVITEREDATQNNDTTSHEEQPANDKDSQNDAATVHKEVGEKLLNNANELPTFRKLINLDGTDHKIINVFGVRSRSAESHSSSSYSMVTSSRSSSSARSSCSSLSTSNRLRPLAKKGGRWSLKNSSSTRSDTGLVLRCHMNNAKCQCARTPKYFRRSSSSSSFSSLVNGGTNLRVCSSLGCVGQKDPGRVTPTGLDSDLVKGNHHRSCSLPRKHRKSKQPHSSVKHSRKTAVMMETSNHIQFPSLGTNVEGWHSVAASHESVAVKRSNLSLASSTCSGSKFVVDPVNELPPSPCLTPLPESSIKEIQFPTNESRFVIPSLYKDIATGKPGSIDSLDSSGLKNKSGHRTGILTKLNNLKSAAQGSRNTLSSGHHSKNTIIRRVKTRDCCSIM